MSELETVSSLSQTQTFIFPHQTFFENFAIFQSFRRPKSDLLFSDHFIDIIK